jgi:hypothetical protein
MHVISAVATGVLLTDDGASRLAGSGVFESSPHYISMRTNLDGCRVSDSGALCSALVRHRDRPSPVAVAYQIAEACLEAGFGG